MNNRLHEFRNKKDITQVELSKLSGISRPYISNIERGKAKRISNVVMLKLANALNESVNDIFFTSNVV